jgi:hypothetical protein
MPGCRVLSPRVLSPGVLPGSGRGGHTGRRKLAARATGSGGAEDLAPPGNRADHQEYGGECGNADGDVDHKQAARQDPHDEKHQGRYDDRQDRAEPGHGYNQPARPVRSRVPMSRVSLGQAELGRVVGLSTCLVVA